MSAYIALMTLGSIAMAAALGTWIFFAVRKRQARFLLKKIGNISETEVNADIKKWAKEHKAAFLPAGLYKYEPNKLFEVDSILVTTKAVVVIEIKSISGIISGAPEDAVWTKTLGEKKFPITNPVKQNDQHIQHLKTMVKFDYPVVSLIIYSNRAQELAIKNLPEHVMVAKHSELVKVLDELDARLAVKIGATALSELAKSFRQHVTRKRADLNNFYVLTEQKK